MGQKFCFIDEDNSSKLKFVSSENPLTVNYEYQLKRGGVKHKNSINFTKFMDVKGWKVLGNKLNGIYRVTDIEKVKTDEKTTKTSISKSLF